MNMKFNHFVSVYEFDQHNKYQVKELTRIKSRVLQITKIRYHENCGLIMACLKGYIEIFDPIKFTSKGRWHDQINPGRKSPELDNSLGEASLHNSIFDQIGSPVTVNIKF